MDGGHSGFSGGHHSGGFGGHHGGHHGGGVTGHHGHHSHQGHHLNHQSGDPGFIPVDPSQVRRGAGRGSTRMALGSFVVIFMIVVVVIIAFGH